MTHGRVTAPQMEDKVQSYDVGPLIYSYCPMLSMRSVMVSDCIIISYGMCGVYLALV